MGEFEAARPVQATVESRRVPISGSVVRALRGRPVLTRVLLLLPGTLWMLIFVGIPLVSVVVFSFWTSGFAGLRPDYTLDNYRNTIGSASFWRITWWTIQVVVMLLAGVIMLAYPAAYGLWRVIQRPHWKTALLLLFIVPFWTSYLTRTITWLPMFGRQGVVNTVLQKLRIIDEPLEFLLYSSVSMMVALWFLFIVFMVGPLYFSMQRIDEDIMSAAAVFGAGPWRTFFHVVLPLTRPGLMAGSLFVVVLGMAEFFTERAIGGAQNPMLAGLILRQVDIFQWAGASAIAVVLITMTLTIVTVMLRFFDIRRV